MDRKKRPFLIVGDIKKAHRRFKHLAKQQGFLAYMPGRALGQLDESCVYINKVDSFDVNCASDWWTRVAACRIRAAHHLLRRCPIDMLLYADELESLATTWKRRIAIILATARKKFRAGEVTAKKMAQGLGRLGFAISLDWERSFLGPLYAWSSGFH